MRGRGLTFAERLTRSRRLALLQTLAAAPAYEGNARLLRDVLAELGLNVGLTTVEVDLAWLANQHLVTIDDLGGLIVARITQHGVDVAAGREVVEGVDRPAPES